MLCTGKIERSLKIRFGEHRRACSQWGNDANQPVARYFDAGIQSVSDIEIRAICPISESNDRHKRLDFPKSFPDPSMARFNSSAERTFVIAAHQISPAEKSNGNVIVYNEGRIGLHYWSL